MGLALRLLVQRETGPSPASYRTHPSVMKGGPRPGPSLSGNASPFPLTVICGCEHFADLFVLPGKNPVSRISPLTAFKPEGRRWRSSDRDEVTFWDLSSLE